MNKLIPITKDIPFRTNISDINSISVEHNINLDDDHILSGEIIVSGEYKLTRYSEVINQFSHRLPIDIAINDEYRYDNLKVEVDDFDYEIINSDVLRMNIILTIDGLFRDDEVELIEEEKEEVEEELVYEQEYGDIPLPKHDELEMNYTEDEMTEEPVDVLEEELNIGLLEDEYDEIDYVAIEEEKIQEVDNEIEEIKKEIQKEKFFTRESPTDELEVEPSVTVTRVSSGDGLDSLPEGKPQVTLEAVEVVEGTEEIDVMSIFDAIGNDEAQTYETYSVYFLQEGDTLESVLEKYDTTFKVLDMYNDLDDLKAGDKLVIPSGKID